MAPPSRTRRASEPRHGGPTAEGVLLALLVALPPVVFWRGIDAAFAAPKLLTVALLTVVLVVVRPPAPRGAATLGPAVPTGPVVVAAAVFLALVTVATATSDVPALSIAGHHGRFSGLVAYTLAMLLLVRVASVRDRGALELLVPGLAAGAAVVALYSALQRLGLDPLSWTFAVDISGSASTLGNPNFASAHAAIGLAVAAGVLWSSPTGRLRAAAWALAVLCVLGLLGSNSLQGYLAAAVGVVVASVAGLARRHPARKLTYLFGTLGAGAVGAALMVLGGTGRGPLAAVAGPTSTQVRLWDWAAAVAIGRDHPLTGVGFDRFSGYANAYRPAEAADLLGPDTVLDTPHSVPLSMLVGGGVPLLLAYLAVVGVTAWALLVGLGRLEGRAHQLLATLGAAWAAYQVQSLVSIDVPSLLTTHAVLAGAIVALGRPPGRWPVASIEGARWRSLRTPATAVGALVLVALLVVPAVRIVWADAASGGAQRARAAGDGATAVERARTAVDRAGWEPRYGELLGFSLGEVGDGPGALEALVGATAADPRSLSPQLNTARLAAALGESELAADRYRTLLELEPNHVDLHREAVAAIAEVDGPAAALEVVDDLVARRPDSAAARALRDEVAATVGS
jgi:putative inorganic carbon (hco3(-)) transporter